MKRLFILEILIGYGEINNDTLEINPFYAGDKISSKIILNEDIMEGYVALDYLVGHIEENEVNLTIYDYNNEEIMQFYSRLEQLKVKKQQRLCLKSSNVKNLYCILFMNEIEATKNEFTGTYNNIELAKKSNNVY